MSCLYLSKLQGGDVFIQKVGIVYVRISVQSCLSSFDLICLADTLKHFPW